MAKTAIKRNNIPNRIIIHPHDFACMFCGSPGVSHMESVLTKRREQIWFHKECFQKYVKECKHEV